VRCGGLARALDRSKCQAYVRLAFVWGKCGCLLALTPRERACVLVAVEMLFSSTFFAASGATELLRGWKVWLWTGDPRTVNVACDCSNKNVDRSNKPRM
jgi:hypothetical protein